MKNEKGDKFMADFFKGYKVWEEKTEQEKKEILVNCAGYYEEKTIDYILEGVSKERRKEFTKDPVMVSFVTYPQKERDVAFDNNVVYVLESLLNDPDKKSLFFKVARNTICAVFVNIFYDVASDPNKKTKFGSIANGFFASITNEFAKGKDFEADMMQAYEEILGNVLDLGPIMEG